MESKVEVLLRDFDGSRTIFPAKLPLKNVIHTSEVQDLEAEVGKIYARTEEKDEHGRVIYTEQR